MLANNTCHVAVIQGHGIQKAWLELIEECGLDKRSDTMLMHSSISQKAADNEARFFFSPHALPGFKYPPEAGSREEAEEADRMPGELCGQSALACWDKNGWFFMNYVRDHIVDDLYATGDAGGEISCTPGAGMIWETEWECPQEPGDRVLAEHPAYPESYAPAIVLEIVDRSDEFKIPMVTVEFYNGFVLDLVQDKCVYLNPEKFDYEAIVANIVELEGAAAREHRPVVCRDDDSGRSNPPRPSPPLATENLLESTDGELHH